MVFILLLVWLVLGSGVTWLLTQGVKQKWISPLASKVLPLLKPEHYVVVGFLPPWNIEKAVIHPEVLDQLIFLGIEVKANGDLVWDSQSKKIKAPTYVAMREKMKAAGKQNILGIKLFEDKKIDALLADPVALQNLTDQVKQVVIDYGFDGVNIDFEYMGDPVAVLEDRFTTFFGMLRSQIGKGVSVDLFANTIIKGDSEGLRKMGERVDQLIVMAYDFHQPGMDFAGPVAPIGSPAGSRNIMEVADRVVTLGLPKSKIIMAYPLYGYEFKTVEATLGAATVGGWGQTATLKRMEDIIKNKTLDNFMMQWDEVSLTPWLSFTKNETAYKKVKVGKKLKSVAYPIVVTYEIYYDNRQSLTAKFNLVQQTQLGGVGFWALGYEGTDLDLWNLIKQYLVPTFGGQV